MTSPISKESVARFYLEASKAGLSTGDAWRYTRTRVQEALHLSSPSPVASEAEASVMEAGRRHMKPSAAAINARMTLISTLTEKQKRHQADLWALADKIVSDCGIFEDGRNEKGRAS